MSQEYEKQLETEVGRSLKNLPELAAPPTLSARVMAALEARSRVPWYRQSWQSWPWLAQAGSLALLLALFAALCFVGGQVPHTGEFATASHSVNAWFSSVTALWNTLATLLGAVGLVVKHLGTGFIVACVLALGLGYAICVGLGTVCFRLAVARR